MFRSDEAKGDAANPRGRQGGRRGRGQILGLAISVALLAALYASVDLGAVAASFGTADGVWLAVSIAIIVPLTLLRAYRFHRAAPAGSLPGYGEAVRLTLAASALNLVFPAKSGDLLKSYFVSRRGIVPAGVSVSLIVYERLCDIMGLVMWSIIGWIASASHASTLATSLVPPLALVAVACAILLSSEHGAERIAGLVTWLVPWKRFEAFRHFAQGWPALHRELRGRRGRLMGISIAMWLLSLTQIWLFTYALSMPVPFLVSLNVAGLALLAGQVPFAFAGLGPRDLAFVVLLAPYARAESAAAVGLLAGLRLFIPAIAALPILRPYVSALMDDASVWARSAVRQEER